MDPRGAVLPRRVCQRVGTRPRGRLDDAVAVKRPAQGALHRRQPHVQQPGPVGAGEAGEQLDDRRVSGPQVTPRQRHLLGRVGGGATQARRQQRLPHRGGHPPLHRNGDGGDGRGRRWAGTRRSRKGRAQLVGDSGHAGCGGGGRGERTGGQRKRAGWRRGWKPGYVVPGGKRRPLFRVVGVKDQREPRVYSTWVVPGRRGPVSARARGVHFSEVAGGAHLAAANWAADMYNMYVIRGWPHRALGWEARRVCSGLGTFIGVNPFEKNQFF